MGRQEGGVAAPSSTRLQNIAAVLGLNAWEQLGRSRDLLHRPFGVFGERSIASRYMYEYRVKPTGPAAMLCPLAAVEHDES
jgi:hypothetical protein